MAIRRKSLDSYAKLKNIAARDDSVLADKIAQLIIWFSLKKKDLSEEDKSRLDSSLVEVYKRYGITFDNSTIVDENEISAPCPFSRTGMRFFIKSRTRGIWQ